MMTPQLGIRENLRQFSLLVLVNGLVGAMVGMERSILPEIAVQDFHLDAKVAVLSFIAVFGVSKAFTNYVAGYLSDRMGRKPLLVLGWLISMPVPFLLMFANSWGLILLANFFLGISQGLTWSTTVIMKIDLSGPKKRGLAMGLNECAGYMAVALSAWATSELALSYGLRPKPFFIGVIFVLMGFLLTLFGVKETRSHMMIEAQQDKSSISTSVPRARDIFWRASFGDRNLFGISQAGLVNNLNDGMAWGLFPLFFAEAGMNLSQAGLLVGLYPATWGVMQLLTGAWSDRVGRKKLIVYGMVVQSIGILSVAISVAFGGFFLGCLLLGVGTAMVYPTLLAAIGDVTHPTWRASVVGVYRLWRDLGYAMGAVMSGVTADLLGLKAAMGLVAMVTFFSGLVAAQRLTCP